MPNEAATTGETPGAGETPAAVAQGNGQGETPVTGSATQPNPDETNGLQSALRKERERAEIAERELKALRTKDLPEAERMKAELQTAHDALAAANVRARKSEVMAEAGALGFANPRIAYATLVELDMLELDKDGQPVNVEQALRKLLRQEPGLARASAVASGSAEGGVRGSAPNGSEPFDMNAMIRGSRSVRRGTTT